MGDIVYVKKAKIVKGDPRYYDENPYIITKKLGGGKYALTHYKPAANMKEAFFALGAEAHLTRYSDQLVPAWDIMKGKGQK